MIQVKRPTTVKVLSQRIADLEAQLTILEARAQTLMEQRDLAINGLLAWNGLPPLPVAETADRAPMVDSELGNSQRRLRVIFPD